MINVKYSDQNKRDLELLLSDLNINLNINLLMEDIKNNDGIIYLLFDDEKCVGFSSAKRKNKHHLSANEILVAQVNLLFLKEEYKVLENYQLIMNDIEKHFKNKQYEYVEVNIDLLINDSEIFEKMGYKTQKITYEKII